MSKQEPLTLVTPVLESHRGELFNFLRQVKLDLEENKHKSFEDIGTIHFARWLVIDYTVDAMRENGLEPKLVFSSNFDGDVNQHIRDLCTVAADLIDTIYACCEGYPPAEERDAESRTAYLHRWKINTSAFYKGAPGRSLSQIRNEDKLHNYLLDFISSKKWDGRTASQIKKEIQEAVLSKPEFHWAKEPVKLPRVNWLGMIALVLALLALSPILIIWVLIVQFGYERKDSYFTLKRSQLDEHKMKKLETYEDLELSNQFSQLVTMKPGKVRLITFKFFMLFARVLIPIKFVKGKLMGIPTIHFARWVLFDNNKRVLFFSNFDGSWQQYLGDFIDQSGWGLTGIFSNTTNFPKTKWLITGGAYDEEHFLAWSRSTEIQTQIWYNAYPHLSIKNVNNNTLIRHELFKNCSEKRSVKFLKLI